MQAVQDALNKGQTNLGKGGLPCDIFSVEAIRDL